MERKRSTINESYDGYQEARAVIEDLVDPANAAAALDRARHYLQTHCQHCGRPLLGTSRGQADGLCRCCQRPPAATAAPPTLTQAQQQVVASGALDRWPTGVRAQLARVWESAALQTLLSDAHAAGYELPILRLVAPGVLGESRQQLLQTPAFLTVVLAAARNGVGVRLLAAVLFGAVPGATSDMIARAIDAADPTARTNRRRSSSFT